MLRVLPVTRDQIEAIESALALPMPNAAVLDAVKASDGYPMDLWAAAMTCAYGPTGLHPSRCDPETGFPLPETMLLADVAGRMERAHHTVRNMVDYLRRYNDRGEARS